LQGIGCDDGRRRELAGFGEGADVEDCEEVIEGSFLLVLADYRKEAWRLRQSLLEWDRL
jgi:hypothetical protein